MVTVYSLPNCVQCDTTKKFLNRKFIEYTEIDISQDAEAYERIKGWGFTQAPVVEWNKTAWSGFRMDMLSQIAA